MKNLRLIMLLLSVLFSQAAMAYGSNEERIDRFIELLNSGDYAAQEEMLNRLQWSGLSDPALFDVVQGHLLTHYQDDSAAPDLTSLLSYQVRALGFSGNERYRQTITEVSQNAASSKLRKYARKALSDLSKFSQWLSLLPPAVTPVEGQSIESATYLAMLSVENTFVQRLAARAIFHERIGDPVLLERAEAIIRSHYMNPDLDAETQDTIAWLCKDLGQNGKTQYSIFLAEVADKTPSRKIAKYAGKYTD